MFRVSFKFPLQDSRRQLNYSSSSWKKRRIPWWRVLYHSVNEWGNCSARKAGTFIIMGRWERLSDVKEKETGWRILKETHGCATYLNEDERKWCWYRTGDKEEMKKGLQMNAVVDEDRHQESFKEPLHGKHILVKQWQEYLHSKYSIVSKS